VFYSHENVITMESKFLQKTLDSTGDANMVRDHIRSMAAGNVLHGSEALMSIFLRLLDKTKVPVISVVPKLCSAETPKVSGTMQKSRLQNYW
jgi:hypothetical protein